MNDKALNRAYGKLCESKFGVLSLTMDEIEALKECCTTYAELN